MSLITLNLSVRGEIYPGGGFLDQMLLYEEFEEIKQLAEKASNAKSVFLATLILEFRAPLNAIIGSVNSLDHTGLNKDQLRDIEDIEVFSRKLLTLINKSLDFAKVETGRVEIDQYLFSLPDLLHDLRLQFATGSNRAESLWLLKPKKFLITSPDGSEIPLTLNETQILTEMAEVYPEFAFRVDLAIAMGHTELDYNFRQLEVTISRLRKKLDDGEKSNTVIRSVRGRGYVFTEPVFILDAV